MRRSAFFSGFPALHLRMNSLSALRLASFLHSGEQYFALALLGENVLPQMWHVVVWAAMSCRLPASGPFDGVVFADAECGYYVVVRPVDVSLHGGGVDGFVVDAGEGFGLAEGDGVWGVWVDGLAGHSVSSFGGGMCS